MNEKDYAASPPERSRNLMGAGTPEINTPNSLVNSVAAAPTIFSNPNDANTPSIVSTADVVAQAPAAASPVTVADGATVEISGSSEQSATFAGATGTLILENSTAFTGEVFGLSGSDALDLADINYNSNTTATFLGNAAGGTLTVSNGTQSASIALQGNYLSSYWTVSSDGQGGTTVVDPVSSNDWQTLDIGAGGNISGIDAVGNVMVIRTDTYGAYIWNGSEWQQLVTATSMPASFHDARQ